MSFSFGQVRKDEFLGVVMNLRVADVALGVFENRADFLRLDVIDAQLSAGIHGERGSALVGRIVRDVGVPMAVDAGLANGEENFVGHAGIEEGTEHRRILDIPVWP